MITVAAVVMAFCAVAAAGVGGWAVVSHLDHRRRIERRQAGMREIPRERRKAKGKREAIPDDIRALIEPFESARVRLGLEEECIELHEGGTPWAEIERMLRQQLAD